MLSGPLLFRRIVVLVSLILVAIYSLIRLNPPTKDQGEFSNANALKDLEFIASEDRPAGSSHLRAVQHFIFERFRQLGYDVQAQSGFAGSTPLNNILARKPGLVPHGKAVMLSAHSDSVRAGPGAADDGAAVAALLEVARIVAGRDHRNDIIFLITDGEEIGLQGAKLFAAEHPWAADVGVVLNFEARGSRGASIMFESTSGWLVDLYAKHAPHPVCSSVSYDVYRKMPNNTDLSIFRKMDGVDGLGFAFIAGYSNYHTPHDDLAHLDPSSMRHHGIQALALANAVADFDMNSMPHKGDLVFFDLLSLIVLRYPAGLAPVIAIVCSLGALSVLFIGLLRRQLALDRMLLSLVVLILSILIACGLCWIIKLATQGMVLSGYANLMFGGYVLIAIVTTASLMHLAGSSARELSAAGLIVWVLLTLYSGFSFRGASYLAIWPMLFATLALGMNLRSKTLSLPSLILFAIPPIILLTPIIYLTFLGLTLSKAHIVVVAVVLALWLLPLQLRLEDPQQSDANLPA